MSQFKAIARKTVPNVVTMNVVHDPNVPTHESGDRQSGSTHIRQCIGVLYALDSCVCVCTCAKNRAPMRGCLVVAGSFFCQIFRPKKRFFCCSLMWNSRRRQRTNKKKTRTKLWLVWNGRKWRMGIKMHRHTHTLTHLHRREHTHQRMLERDTRNCGLGWMSKGWRQR